VAADWTVDVGIAPAGVLARVAAGINQRPRRALGFLKTQNEYVGVIGDDGFEIWERQQRAVHALGVIRARAGGCRIELRFILPARTRVLLVLFFVLYVVVAAGIALRDPEPVLSAAELVTAAAGAAALGLLFTVGATRQRADLRAFFERLFGDVPRT
jgi:hypothetical protein